MKRLLESMRKRIKENKYGNIEPIIITQDKVIVSGHQRVRVFKELKIPTIEAEIRIYKSEDDVLLDLLESNIRRRGEIGDSAKKVGKRIKELERLYGIQNGGDRGNQYKVAEPNNSALAKSQSDLATQMGISVDTLQNYKMLADMIAQNREKFMFSILETHD
jgi:ParB family chromosome partitioning protein